MDIACLSVCSCSAKRWTKRAFCKSRMPTSKAQSGKRRVRRSLERCRQRESPCSGGKPGEIVFKGHAPVPCELWKHGRLHFTARFRFSRRTINFNPDQVSSIAHTFTSTNPSGNATARITSSVTSVSTLADLFGQETQTVPVSAIFSRKTDNLFSNSLRLLTKMWTKPASDFKRSEKITLSGVVPSNRR